MICMVFCYSWLEVLAPLAGGSGVVGLIMLIKSMRISMKKTGKYMKESMPKTENVRECTWNLKENLDELKENSTVDCNYCHSEPISYSLGDERKRYDLK